MPCLALVRSVRLHLHCMRAVFQTSLDFECVIIHDNEMQLATLQTLQPVRKQKCSIKPAHAFKLRLTAVVAGAGVHFL